MDKIETLEKISEMLRKLGDDIVEGIGDEAGLYLTEYVISGIIASFLKHCESVINLIRQLEKL